MYAVIPRNLRGLGVDVETSASEPGVIPIFAGWNIWNIWQANDLDFSIMNIGLTPERQLRIWAEDQIREKAGAAEVADPLALKGSQIQVLPGLPSGLTIMMRKEQVPGCEGDGCVGPTMVINGPGSLKTVRFFNRSNTQTSMPWPHDDNYLVDAVYIPSVGNPITSGGAPDMVITPVTQTAQQAGDAAGDVAGAIAKIALVAGGIYLAVMFGPLVITQVKKSLEAQRSMIYSKWLADKGGYAYYETTERRGLGDDLPSPRLSQTSSIGVASTDAGRPLPLGAKLVGYGPVARGCVTVLDRSGLSGFTTNSTWSALLLVGAAVASAAVGAILTRKAMR